MRLLRFVRACSPFLAFLSYSVDQVSVMVDKLAQVVRGVFVCV